MNKTKLILILIIVATTIVTCINPIYPHEQYLQHAGTVLLLIPLWHHAVSVFPIFMQEPIPPKTIDGCSHGLANDTDRQYDI